MGRVVQRRLGILAAAAALVVGWTAFEMMREPLRSAADPSAALSPERREPSPPPFVPAAGAVAAKVESVEAPRSVSKEPVVTTRAPDTSVLHLRGRLVGIVATAPWKTPVFVRLQLEERDEPVARRSTIRIRPPKRRREGPPLPTDPSPAKARAELLPPWDPITEPDPTPERLSYVDAHGNRVPPPSSPVAADGTFDVSIDRASLAHSSRIASLDLVANDPNYMPVVRSADLAQLRIEEIGDFDWTIEVEPAGRVTGLVDARDRGERAGQAGLGAMAALFEGTLDDASSAPVDLNVANDRYVLRAPKTGAYTVVVVARDHAPAWLPVDVVVGVEREQPTVMLDRGAAIRGTIRWPPFDRASMAFTRTGVPVTAFVLTRDGKAIDLPGEPLLFANGKLERRSVTIQSNAPDRARADFAFGGLAEGHDYRVLIGDLSLAGASALRDHQPLVPAPARDVELVFDLAYLGVTVTSGIRSLPEAHISISSMPSDPDAPARTSWLLPPYQEGELLVEADGFEPAREHFAMGPAGTTTAAQIELVKKTVHAELDLAIECDGIDAVRFASVRFEPQGDAKAAAFTRGGVATGASLPFKDLPVGTWRLHFAAVAGESAGHERKSDEVPPHRFENQLLDPDLVVELEDGATCSRSVALHEGAALRLTCHDVSGRGITAGCRLVDAAGKPVKFLFVTGEPPISWSPLSGWAVVQGGARTYGAQQLDGDLQSRTDPALPPGRYVLTATHEGYETMSLPFELERGEVRDFDVVLTRKP